MIALSIAGFDPSGGAGILADVKTFNALGIYPTAVVTALTAQNVQRVGGIKPVEPDFVAQQIDLILEAEEIRFAKTGMLHSPEIVKLVATKVKEYHLRLVVDPVMVAGSGGNLSNEGLVDSLTKYLLPNAVLATPNIHEAQKLTGIEINSEDDAYEVAKKLGKICPTVVTGGHLKGRDIFYKDTLEIIEGKIFDSKNTHGSGCTYSAAVTAFMVKGNSTEESVRKASYFTKKAIENGEYGTLYQFWRSKTH